MIVRSGNILDVEEGIICQQVNCQGVMGAGIALSIKKKWPVVYEQYRKQYGQHGLHLGDVIIIKVSKDLYVACLCGQEYYGRKGKFTDYLALGTCMESLNGWRKGDSRALAVYMPYGIGCALAGGDWKIVKGLITTHIPDTIVIKYNGR